MWNDTAKDDAGVLTVQTAVASAMRNETVLIGDETDLLVLLLHHADCGRILGIPEIRAQEILTAEYNMMDKAI